MDDRLQLYEARQMAESEPPAPEVTVFYDSSTESCDLDFNKNGVLPNDAHLSESGIDSEGSLDRSERQYTTVLLREEQKKSELFLSCPSCYNFLKSYRSTNPEERVTPFALGLLFVLFVVYVLNQADRLVLPVVIPDGLRCYVELDNECANQTNTSAIEGSASGSIVITFLNDSNLSDANNDCIDFSDDEQGLLTGPAFTVIYVLAGLPLARLADTRSRPFVLIFGVVFWSVMVLLTGFVESFWQLLVLRIFLGIGEASCNPVAYSLIADFFPARHRAFALSIYHYGVYLGGGLGWMSGAINVALDWRWTFRILGIAGLVIVPVVMLALWEPRAIREKRKSRQKGKAVYTIKEVVVYLGTNPPFWLLLIAASVRNIPGYALGAWLPTFYKREFGVSSQHYGIPVGLSVIFGGGLGSFLGGFISDRLSSRWKNAKAYVIAVSQFLAAPCIAGVLLVPTPEASYGLLVVAYITAETWLGPAAAIVQDICMPAMRAQASAIYVGVITIVASLGPVIVPALFHLPIFDECSTGVGYALLLTVPIFYVCSSLLFSLLGCVIYYWEKRQAKKLSSYDVFTNENAQASDVPQ